MKRLTLEIHGTGTHNRGAELMAIAIGERIRSSFPGARIVVSRRFGSTDARRGHGFLTDAEFSGGRVDRVASRLLRNGGPWIRSLFSFVDPTEIDIVLDASGFAFSDQWGPGPAASLVRKMNRPERKGTPLVLLPQALGPFSDPDVQRASRALFQRAALVCARDRRSQAEARPLVDAEKLKRYPDFTVGVRSVPPSDVELPSSFSAIVPNYRMLDKTEEGENYLTFLDAVIGRLSDMGMNPVFVLHDSKEDHKVIEMVGTGRQIDVLQDSDPRVLKGILGAAELVVGSRFHGLASALSEGVPCVGAGWSHKYPELFRDFGVPELLVANLADLEHLDAVLEGLRTPEARSSYRERIRAAGDILRDQTQHMWQTVEDLIRAKVPAASG